MERLAGLDVRSLRDGARREDGLELGRSPRGGLREHEVPDDGSRRGALALVLVALEVDVVG